MSEIPLVIKTVVLLPLFLGRCIQSSSFVAIEIIILLLINHANNPFFAVSNCFHILFLKLKENHERRISIEQIINSKARVCFDDLLVYR